MMFRKTRYNFYWSLIYAFASLLDGIISVSTLGYIVPGFRDATIVARIKYLIKYKKFMGS